MTTLPSVENGEREQALATLAYLQPKDVTEQIRQVQTLMKEAMHVNEHYGVIPGTPKPTLFKAGAEKLAFMFRLAPSYRYTTTEVAGGHYRYDVTCQLTSLVTNRLVAEGLGCCSSMESKYRWRKQGGQKVENDAIEDLRNTVMKMAAKRALVAATLNATAASDIFTQDTEDLPEGHVDAPAASKPAPASPPVEPPKENKWLTITSKYEGICVGCGKPYRKGDKAWWNPSRKGMRCLSCGEPPSKASRGATPAIQEAEATLLNEVFPASELEPEY